MMAKQPSPIRVGIVGFGTVGQATAAIIAAHQAEIVQRVGRPLEITAVCRRHFPADLVLPPGARVVTDWRAVVTAPDVDLLVETMGGTTTARDVIAAALRAGKPVVTANKNLLAEHGDELFALAVQQGLPLGFEAAVAGGVPVIRAVAEGAAGDRLHRVFGILNGTANFILTRMQQTGGDFTAALIEAQAAGYAEADPAFDVDGFDARDKLVILARIAFGGRVTPADIPTLGIRAIRAVDIHYARRLDSTIRLIASAARGPAGVEIAVRPWLVPLHSMLARVEGVNNAVFLDGQKLGLQMFYGRGAGGDATGVAVVSDLIELASDLGAGNLAPKLLAGFGAGSPLVLSQNPEPASWYLRLTVGDRPGILAHVAEALAHEGINIDSVIQEPHMEKQCLSFVITVEPVAEPVVLRALGVINQCPFMLEPVLLLRMDG